MRNSRSDDYIAQELSGLESTIKVLSSINKTDFAVELENFLIPIFNIYFETTFTNLNNVKQNFSGIDLYSETKEIAIQVTVDKTAKKKRNCLSKVEKLVDEGKLKIMHLYIFVLTSSQSRVTLVENDFYQNENVLNIQSILKLSTKQKISITEYIKENYKIKFNGKFMKNKILINNVFVHTKVYENALKMIEEKHVLILNGNAGTGKTITSYKVLFDYLEKGYMYLNSLQCLPKSKDSCQKYILFVDDAIAPTDVADANFEKIEETFSIVDLANGNLKIILNSRTNIINSYGTSNSRFNIGKYKKYFISTEQLTDLERFYIFVNHIENSYDKQSLLNLFKADKRNHFTKPIVEIIQHQKFNPRIIEYFQKDVIENENKLAMNILEALNKPDKIYIEQFENLCELEKRIMKYIAINVGQVTLQQLMDYFKTEMEVKVKNCLENLDNSFLLQSEVGANVSYSFFNPSIKDFCDELLKCENNLEEHFTVFHPRNTIVSLLKYPNISDKVKIDTISKHPDKKNIIKNNPLDKQTNFNWFKGELEEIFIDDCSIPYSYLEFFSKDDIEKIEEKFNPLKAKYIQYYGLTNYFIRMIENNSELLSNLDVQNKIVEDYLDSLNSYIYDELDLSIYDTDCIHEQASSTYGDGKIDEMVNEFYNKITHEILKSISHKNVSISYLDWDEWSVSIKEALEIVDVIQYDVINVHNLIYHLSKSKLECDICTADLIDYIENNIESVNDNENDDELTTQIDLFEKRVNSIEF